MTQMSTQRRPDPAEMSMGELVSSLSEQTSRLVRDEIKLATKELQAKGKHAGLGAGMFGGAGVVALFGVGALVTAAIGGLAMAMDVWAAALIVAVVLFAVAGVLATHREEAGRASGPPGARAGHGRDEGRHRHREGARAPMTTSEQSTASAETQDEPQTIEDLEAEIEQTREELGATVDALAHKLDVKSRAHDKVDDIRSAAHEKVEDVKTVVQDKTSAVGSQMSDGRDTAADMGERVKPVAQRREFQAAAVAVLVGIVAVVISAAAGSEGQAMVKLLYKPMAIALGVLAGSLAGKVVTKVWTKVDDNDVPPEPDLKEASWGAGDRRRRPPGRRVLRGQGRGEARWRPGRREGHRHLAGQDGRRPGARRRLTLPHSRPEAAAAAAFLRTHTSS